MDQPVPALFVLLLVKTTAHVQHPTFAIGNYSDIFFTHLILCNCLSVQARGMAVFVKYVRNRARSFLAISDVVHLFFQLSAILHVSTAATALHPTRAFVSHDTSTLVASNPLSSSNTGDTVMWTGSICQTR